MKRKTEGPRVLFLDIETAPLLAGLWDIWNMPGYTILDMIEKDWHMLSFGAKWLGDPEMIYHSQEGRRNVEDDKVLLGILWNLMDEADWIIAHNGRRFDVPAINTRLVLNGYKPPSPFVVIDTQKDIAKKHFKFTSMKLAYLSRKLCRTKKSIHKKFPGFLLWKECLKGNPEAWAEMKAYNLDDVKSLEELYLILRPWCERHPNFAAFKANTDGSSCSKCGGQHLESKGFRVTNAGKYRRYRCHDCGGHSNGPANLLVKSSREKLLRP